MRVTETTFTSPHTYLSSFLSQEYPIFFHSLKMTFHFNSSVDSTTCRNKQFLPGTTATILIFSSDFLFVAILINAFRFAMKRDPTRQMAARSQAWADDLLKACFPELPDGVNIPVMLFIEIGTPNIPLFWAKSFYLDNISSLALFRTSPRTGKKGEQFITHESLILMHILTEIQFLLNTYFEYYIHIHMQ